MVKVYRQRGQTDVQPPTSRKAVWLLLPAILLALSVGLYANSLNNPLIIDDPIAIQFHPDVAQPEGLWRLWTRDYWAGTTEDRNLFRPVTVLSFHLNARAMGQKPDQISPWAFRIVNVILLATLGWITAAWLCRYTGLVAAAIAAVFLVAHPVNTELINHLVGRADLLAMISVVGFLYFQRRAQQIGRWTPVRCALAGGLAFVAMGSKETGLVVVPLALLQAWLLHAQPPAGERRAWIYVGSAISLGVPLFIYALLRFVAVGASVGYPASLSDDLTGNPLRGLPIADRIVPAMAITGRYVRQVFYPYTSFNQLPPALPTLQSPPVWLGIAAVVVGAIWLFWALRNRRWIALPLMLALAHLMLVSNLLFATGVYAAPRLTLPFIVAASALVAMVMDPQIKSSPRRSGAAVAATVVLTAIMAAMVVTANRNWETELARMEADAMDQPLNPAALYHYGTALANAGQNNKAVERLRDAVIRRQDSLQARFNLAGAMLQAGQTERAVEEYGRILERDPNQWRVHSILGAVNIMRQDYGAAQQHLEQARRLNPSSIEVLYNSAELAKARGEYSKALQLYEALLVQDPNHKQGMQMLAELREALLRQSRPPK